MDITTLRSAQGAEDLPHKLGREIYREHGRWEERRIARTKKSCRNVLLVYARKREEGREHLVRKELTVHTSNSMV